MSCRYGLHRCGAQPGGGVRRWSAPRVRRQGRLAAAVSVSERPFNVIAQAAAERLFPCGLPDLASGACIHGRDREPHDRRSRGPSRPWVDVAEGDPEGIGRLAGAERTALDRAYEHAAEIAHDLRLPGLSFECERHACGEQPYREGEGTRALSHLPSTGTFWGLSRRSALGYVIEISRCWRQARDRRLQYKPLM